MNSDDLEQRYRAATPTSRLRFEAARASTAGAVKGAYFHSPWPLSMARGEGCTVVDVDGNRYVDFQNHHTAQILGHGNAAVRAAVEEQLERGAVLGAPAGAETELAAEMCRRVASVERIRFTNSGTEATLHAVRLLRGVSGRPRVAKFEGGYHGSHDAVEISVAPPLEKAGPASAPVAVPGTGGISPGAVAEALILPYDDEAAVEALLKTHRHEVGCVLLDPKAGILPQRPAFVRFVREITRDLDMLLMFDEIVGFRMGMGGLQAHYGIDPDVTTFGKLVGGGFPVGAFGGRADLMERFDNTGEPTGFSQSGTFSGHPVTAAAGLATLRQLTPGAFAHLNDLGQRLQSGLREVFERRGVAAEPVVTGSLFSIHFVEPPLRTWREMARADRERGSRVFLSVLLQGCLLSHSMAMNALSLPMEAGHVDGLVEAVDRALDA